MTELKANFWLHLYDGGVTVSPIYLGPLYGDPAEMVMGRAEVIIDAHENGEGIDANMCMSVKWERAAFQMSRKERSHIAELGGALILDLLEGTDDREYEKLQAALTAAESR